MIRTACCSAVLFVLFIGSAALAGPVADYGDAPDPTYPSLFTSGGPYHFDTGREWLGSGVVSTTTTEPDSKQVDLDNDDGSAYYLSGPGGNWFHTTVSYNPNLSLASDARYLNVLVDSNNSGQWDGTRSEWIVRNYSVRFDLMPVGITTAEVFIQMPAGVDPNAIASRTTRVTLSDQTVSNGFGAWGQFQRGETEDWVPTDHGGSGITPPVNPTTGHPSIGPKTDQLRNESGWGKWILNAPFVVCSHGLAGALTPEAPAPPARVYDWQVNVPTSTVYLDVTLSGPVPPAPHLPEPLLDIAQLVAPGGAAVGAGAPTVLVGLGAPPGQVTPGQINLFTGRFRFPGHPAYDARNARYNLIYDPEGMYFMVSNNNGVPTDPAYDSPSGTPSSGDYPYDTALFALPGEVVPEPGTAGLLVMATMLALLRLRRRS